MSAPIVSVVIPSYNHGRFIGEAIRSALAQDFEDFELLVSDDGSTDDTVEVARSFSDPRITVFAHGENRGGAANMNEAVARSRGQFVAVLNSDDAWTPGKLKTQVATLVANPDLAACFGRAIFVDVDSRPLLKEKVGGVSVFDVENRSRGAWLRHFLVHLNCLCHPTVLMRREVYAELGPFDPRLRQLPDFEMWLRLVKRRKFTVLNDVLVRFRLMPGENASASTPSNNIRTTNEIYLIARNFFDGVSRELLIEGFADLLIKPALPTPEHVDIEKAAIMLKVESQYGKLYRIVGLSRLFDLFLSSRHRDIMISDYAFDIRGFHDIAGQIQSF